MNSFCDHKILKDKKLVIQYFSGHVDLRVANEVKSKVLRDLQYDSSYNSIVDFRDTNLDFTEDEIEIFIDFLKKENDANSSRKTVLLTNTPNQVVVLTRFSFFAKNLPVYYNIVSTINAAINWVDLSNKDETSIDKIIDDLKVQRKLNEHIELKLL